MKKISFICLTGLLWMWTAGVGSETIYLNRGPLDPPEGLLVSQKWPDENKNQDYFMLQLKGPVVEGVKEILTKNNVKLLQYIPQNTFIVRMNRKAWMRVSRLPFVRWIGQYSNYFRISPSYSLTTIFNLQEHKKVIAKFFEGADVLSLSQKLKKGGAIVFQEGEDSLRVIGTREQIYILESFPDLEWLQEDLEFELLSSDFDGTALTGYESGNFLMDVNALHALGVTGKTQILGYSDTGLDTGINDETLHKDFQGKILKAYFAEKDNWKDPKGHGTHIGGLLVGNGALSEGKIRASAYEAQLVVQSLMLEGVLRVPLDIGRVIFAPAYQDGVRIHSNSWGAAIKWIGYPAYTVSVDKFIWEHPDFVALFPSGNSGADMDQNGVVDVGLIYVPGNCKNCITVGASENVILTGGAQLNWQIAGLKDSKWMVDPIASDLMSDRGNGIAAFSSRGPTSDGRLKPDIVAPGTNILSTRSHISSGELWGIYNEDYIWLGGTSTSTPLVASGLALLREYLQVQKQIDSPSAALLKALLMNGAKDLYPGQFGVRDAQQEIPHVRPNVQEGWGLVSLEQSVLDTEFRKILFYDEKEGLATGEEKVYHVDLSFAGPVSVTLVYMDAPSASSASRLLVNDLDLEVIDSSGKLYFPNGLAQKDEMNNVEGIDIPTPPLGTLTVKIKAFNVPSGIQSKQPYACVISGGINQK